MIKTYTSQNEWLMYIRNKFSTHNISFTKIVDHDTFHVMWFIYAGPHLLRTKISVEEFTNACASGSAPEFIKQVVNDISEELDINTEPKESKDTMIQVLDHGFVRLVDHMGSDLSIIRAARVSYDAAWRAGENEEGDTKLLRYLWKNKHTTPFEAVTFTFEVKAPIFVFRQWHRHRTQSYNELSARYKQLPKEYYVPTPAIIGVQSKDNKQGRTAEYDVELIKQREVETQEYMKHCDKAYELYEQLLAKNWPRELARAVLPVSMYSHMFTTMNLLNLFKFLTLRTDPHAQYEIREYADAMHRLITPIVPIAVKAWEDFK